MECHALGAAKDSFALFLKCADALVVVVAVIDQPAQALDAFETLWAHWVCASQDPQLFLHDSNGKRCVFGDRSSKVVGERLKFVGGYDIVDQACSFGTIS